MSNDPEFRTCRCWEPPEEVDADGHTTTQTRPSGPNYLSEGKCHRFPQVVSWADPLPNWDFPQAYDFDWCGEWVKGDRYD